jgi:hypothetical protein
LLKGERCGDSSLNPISFLNHILSFRWFESSSYPLREHFTSSLVCQMLGGKLWRNVYVGWDYDYDYDWDYD